jgi:hypothetical protein
VRHQLTAICHQLTAPDEMLSRSLVDDALPLPDTRQACVQLQPDTPTHPLLAAQADNILVYTHPASHFVSKHFTSIPDPPPPDMTPLCFDLRL